MKRNWAIMGILLSTSLFGSITGEENFVKLEETIIKDNGYELTLEESGKSAYFITEEEIREKNYRDVTEVLRDSPFINVREDEMGVVIDMRGRGLNAKAAVQVLVNGTAINPIDMNHGSLPLNLIPISTVKKIEILPGGNSVIYGDGATGGVINILTHMGTQEKNSFDLGGRYASYSYKQWEMNSAANLWNKTTLQINYSGADGDTHRASENIRRENLSMDLNYEPSSEERMGLRYSYGEERLKTGGMLTRSQLSENPSHSGVDFEGIFSQVEGNGDILDSSHIRRNDLYGTYEKKIRENLTLNLLANYQHSENRAHKRELNQINVSQRGMDIRNYYADLKGTFTDEKIKVNPSLRYEYFSDSYLLAGYEFRYQKSTRDFENFMDMYKVYDLDSKKYSNGGYLFNKGAYGDWEFTQGYRREWTSFDTKKETHYYHRVAPAFINNGYIDTGLRKDRVQTSALNDALDLAVNYLHSERGNAFIRFEKSFRTPSPTEFQDKNGKGYEFNNLDSEKSHSVEVGVRDFIWDSLISATLFYTWTEDEILYNEISHGKEYYYLNLDRTERKGIEFAAEQYMNNLTLTEIFSYLDAKITDGAHESPIEGKRVPYAPKFNFNFSAKYLFTENFNGIITVNYKGKQYLDRENRFQMKDYFSVNLSLNYLVNERLLLYVGINNLLDRKNISSGTANEEVALYVPSPPRNYFGGFRYSY